jgi:GntR family transcriptional regulator
MILNLSDLSNEPLQSQIVRQIRAKILAGDLRVGTALPSIRSLAREQHISVITVQRAYEALEREGLIESRPRKGFFVVLLSDDSKKETARQRLRNSLAPLIQIAFAEGLTIDEIQSIFEGLLAEPALKTS